MWDADAELAHRDDALPGLRLLLDEDAFTEALRAARPDAGVSSARATYVRYKPGTSCLLGYVISREEGGDVLAYARAERPGELDRRVGNLRRADAEGPLGRGVALAGHDVAVYPFPNDRRIRALRDVADPDRRRRLLERKAPDRPDLASATLQPLRFKPERRFVGRLDGGRGRALIKLYGTGFEDSLAATEALSGGPVRVPQSLARSRRQRLLVLEWLEGETIAVALRAGDPAAAAEAGTALAALHGSSVPGLTTRSRESGVAAVGPAADAVAWLAPDAADAARGALDRIRPELAAETATVPIHGDFSAGQVLLGPAGPALLDLDEARIGRPEEDLGSFLAALQLDVLRGDLPWDDAARAAQALLEGYSRGGRLPGDGALRRFTAAALLRLAPEPFRHRQPDWPDAVRSLVACAEELAAG
jgi:hypothetical protein